MRYRVMGDTLARQMSDELVLVNTATNRIFVANETGARIWQAIEQQENLDGVITALLEQAPNPQAARTEVEQFLSGLLREGLVASS